MKKSIIALTIAGLTSIGACGGKTVYVVDSLPEVPGVEETDAPETTKAPRTTPAPTRPPATVPSSSTVYDPEGYDTFLWTSVKDFWWLFDKEELLTMGLLVCEEFDRGSSIEDVTQQLINAMTNTNTAYLMEGLAAVTAGALTYLCPEHSWWLETL